MAVASDAMYNPRTVVQSFMSSNTYYGYVPPYRNESQFNAVLEHADINESSVFDRCSFETAMETGNDDDGCDYSVASSYLNNNSVILEASARNLLKANHGHQQCQQQPAHNDADTLRRRNRKRCNGDLSPTSELKKFRRGGGVSYAHCGATSTEDHGLAAMLDQSELLRVNADDRNLRDTWIINGGCCWAAGNHNQLNNSDYKRLSSSCGLKSTEDDAEYEKILFETHGCSVYHLHRLHALDNDCIETEF